MSHYTRASEASAQGRNQLVTSSADRFGRKILSRGRLAKWGYNHGDGGVPKPAGRKMVLRAAGDDLESGLRSVLR